MTLYLAKLFPNAHVYGIDLSEVRLPNPPPNVTFIRGNIVHLIGEDPRLQPNSVDYLFNRFLNTGIDDWPAYFAAVCRLVKPDGWFELHDAPKLNFRIDGRLVSHEWEWVKYFQSPGEPPEDDPHGLNFFQGLLQDNGFEEIDGRPYKMPWSPPPAECPEDEPWVQYISTPRHQWWRVPLLELKFPREEDRELKERLREEMIATIAPEKGKYMPFCAVWGRKKAA